MRKDTAHLPKAFADDPQSPPLLTAEPLTFPESIDRLFLMTVPDFIGILANFATIVTAVVPLCLYLGHIKKI